MLVVSSWTCDSCSSNDADLEVLAVDLDEEVSPFSRSSASVLGVLLPIEPELCYWRSSSISGASMVLVSVRCEVDVSWSRL